MNPTHLINRTLPRLMTHIDWILFCALLTLSIVGLVILYSAANQDLGVLWRQLLRLGFGVLIMLTLAQIPPDRYQRWAPWLFFVTLASLVIVLILGHIGKGAQRWLNFGLFHFQPSEFMKLALPIMLAWYLHDQPQPLSKSALGIVCLLTAMPVLLIAKQPDLGTALLVGSIGVSVIFLGGIGWRLFTTLTLLTLSGIPLLWHFMHHYQRERLLIFLNPERDPLGSGYHIIQSKIAIGSGGLYGRGFLNGTQSHLQFLPECTTDFIFSVAGEEWGLIGASILLVLFLVIIARGLYISTQAQNTFSRLLAGTISLAFFVSVFVNMGMVIGILPVVGVPLPLVSYGGTSVVTVLSSFGILMSIHTHRKLLTT